MVALHFGTNNIALHAAERYDERLDADGHITLLLAACRRDVARLAAADTRLLANEGWRERFLDLAMRHGVLGLVLTGLQRQRCFEGVSAEASDRIRETLRGLRRRATILELERVHVVRILVRHGLDAVVLKGAGLASTVYRESVERDFGDIDVLLPPHQIDGAVEALGRHSYGYPGPKEATEGYLAHHFHLRVQRPHGTVIELHWGLTLPREGFRLDAAAYQTQSVAALANGAQMRVPRPEHALLHMVVENVRDAFSRLTRLVDVDRIVAAAPAMDWDNLEITARASGLGPALALVLELSRSVLGTEIPEEVRRHLRPPAAVRFHIALLRPAPSLLWQRTLTRPSWGALMRLWLLTSRSRVKELAKMLRADSDDPLDWLWTGGEATLDSGTSLGYRLSRLGKVVAYQLGLYVTGGNSSLAGGASKTHGRQRIGSQMDIW